MSFLRTLFLKRPYSLVVAALLFALLNVPKPLLIDDTAYAYYARQIARDPLHPYDFDILWYQWPDRANEVLAPPGLPYWWAIAIRLFGEEPIVWKLWLFPYCLLFVVALDALFRRFCRGLETPLLWMTVFSPTFLPSLNLMLDVPALSLALGGIALFFRASARDSFVLAILAGLLAGLGMETKYTAFMAPAVVLLYASLFCRLHLGLVAAGVAGLFFYGCEAGIAVGHGESHFLLNLKQQSGRLSDKFGLVWPLLTIVGGVAPAVTLLGMAGLGARGRTVALTAGAMALGVLAVALFDGGLTLNGGNWVEDLFGEAKVFLSLEIVVFRLFGLLTLVVTIRGLCRLLGTEQYWLSPFWRVDLFLALWLLGEIVAYFPMTPFPAVRRVMGVIVVGTLLAGRLASRTCLSPQRRRLVQRVAFGGVLLGFGFYTVDMFDAFASKDAAEAAAEAIRERDPDARIWYVGHWGFQFYAERAGMEPVVPDRSVLYEGDWLVKPEWRLNQQMIRVNAADAEEWLTLDVPPGPPLRTVQCFYGGYAPLERHEGHRACVTIYRVTQPFVAATLR